MSSFTANSSRTPGNLHVLILATGSVASIKLPLIVHALLQNSQLSVQIIATESSLTFFDVDQVEALGKDVKVWRDQDEWATWKKIGDPILHIELRRWADVVLVAPCSANTLAKIAGGLCDNLATSLLRALDPSTPTYLFPAMNTHMFAHPLTSKHLRIVESEIGYRIKGPIGKELACGDIGLGAMVDWKDIVRLVEEDHLKPHLAQTTVPSSSDFPTPSFPSPSLHTRLFSPLDTLISYSSNTTPSQGPAKREVDEFDLEARHPLVLSLEALEPLQAKGTLPPSLVHSPWNGKDDVRVFWFCPERLQDKQLRALAAAFKGEGAHGGEDEEVEKTRRWLSEKFETNE